MWGARVGGIVAGLAAAAIFAAPATARTVTQYYVSPIGSGTDCTPAAPCDITYPQSVDNVGDEVIVEPGTYTIGTATVGAPSGGSIHGVAGEAKPVIVGSGSSVLYGSGADTVMTDIAVEATGSSQAVILSGAGAVADRLEVSNSGNDTCVIDDGALIRNSVCENTGTGHALAEEIAASTETVKAVNVTAISTGPGSAAVYALTVGGNLTMQLRSVIADGSGNDLFAEAASNGTATIDAAASNFDSVDTSAGTGSTATATPPGSPTDQTAAPQFVAPLSGDYHEAQGSPTIDAGLEDADTGTKDFEGDKRIQGNAVDIGADEYDSTPPKVKITNGPPKTIKTTHKKVKVTFKFSSPEIATFTCKLDNAPYKPCESPKSYRVGKGTHTFAVRAADANGNKSKPAKKTFTVKRKHH